MEDTLGVELEGQDRKPGLRVLILVLMEDTLGVINMKQLTTRIICLNPCFNGRYSRSWCKFEI